MCIRFDSKSVATPSRWRNGWRLIRKLSVSRTPAWKAIPSMLWLENKITGYGGTFTFCIKGCESEAFRLLDGAKLFTLAESLGGVESLIEHPWSMTHASMLETVRQPMGIRRNLVRVSVGIEHIDDQIADLAQALEEV